MSEVFYTIPTNGSVLKLSKVSAVSHIVSNPTSNNYLFRVSYEGGVPLTPTGPVANTLPLSSNSVSSISSSFILVIEENQAQLETYRNDLINAWIAQANGTLTS